MSRFSRLQPIKGSLAATAVLTLVLLGALAPGHVQACPACLGRSDSPMAEGMGWGILSLLGIVLLVLGGVAGFFVYVARRSAAVSAGTVDGTPVAEVHQTEAGVKA